MIKWDRTSRLSTTNSLSLGRCFWQRRWRRSLPATRLRRCFRSSWRKRLQVTYIYVYIFILIHAYVFFYIYIYIYIYIRNARLFPTSYTLHHTPYTLHPTPYTLHPTLCTPSLKYCTLHQSEAGFAREAGPWALVAASSLVLHSLICFWSKIVFLTMLDCLLEGRGAEDAQGTPTHSHISPSILVYEENEPQANRMRSTVTPKTSRRQTSRTLGKLLPLNPKPSILLYEDTQALHARRAYRPRKSSSDTP